MARGDGVEWEAAVAGVKIIKLDVFGDELGWFFEIFDAGRYRKVGIENVFLQGNESFSSNGYRH